MFKKGEVIQVSQSYAFDVVYERIYLGDTGKESCPFLCVDDEFEEAFHNNKPFKTLKWRFARKNDTIYHVKKEKKKVSSGIDLTGFKDFYL